MSSQPKRSRRADLKTKFNDILGRLGKPRASSVEAGPSARTSATIPQTLEGANLPTLMSLGSSPPVLNESVVEADVLVASPKKDVPISDATAIIALRGNGSNLPLNIIGPRQEGKEETRLTSESGPSQSSSKDAELQSEPLDCFEKALKLLEPKDLEAWKAMQSDLPPDGATDNIDKLDRLIQKQRTTIPGINTQKLEDPQTAKLVAKQLESFLKIAKPFVMVLSRLDPHGLAPLISAGSFFAVELLLGVNTISLDMIDALLEIESQYDITMRKWRQIEKYTMCNHQKIVLAEQKELQSHVSQLYVVVIRLVTSVYKHMKASRLKKFLKSEFSTQLDEWRVQLKTLKRVENTCESMKSKIETALKYQEDNLTILNWVTKHSPVDDHVQIQKSTHLLDSYQSAGTWFFEELKFIEWETGIKNPAAKFSVLWIKGTVGTGKTTLICSTISHLLQKYQEALEFSSAPNVIFFYYCFHEGQGESKPTYENIIRALVKQYATQIDFSAASSVRSLWEKSKVESLKITISEWENVLKELIRGSSGTALAFDALDECEKVDVMKLLKFFKDVEAMNPAFRLILSSQEHINVNLYFKPESLSLIETASGASKDDMTIFVEGQINMAEDLDLNPEVNMSIMYENNYLVEKLKAALLARANGMFQWVKIWIALFYPLTPLRIKDDAERLLAELEGLEDNDESSTGILMLVDAYRRLLDHNAPKYPTERIYMIRAYQLLLCCKKPWTCDTLCQAVSIRPNGTLDESIKPDLVRSWCFNFFKMPDLGVIEISHDSARQFLEKYAKLDTRHGQQNFSPPSCNLEMAELCLQVMNNNTHEIWKKCDFGPQTWRESWKLVRQLDHVRDLDTDVGYDTFQKLAVIKMPNRKGFAVYVCLYWLWHCRDVAPNNPMFLSKLVNLIHPDSSFNDWGSFVLVMESTIFEFSTWELKNSLKMLITDSLKNGDNFGESFHWKPSLLLFLIGCNLFEYIFPPVSLSIQENLQDHQTRQEVSEVEKILKDLDSRNAFGQTGFHLAARYRSQQSIEKLIHVKRLENKEALFQYLCIPDNSGRTVLHRAVDKVSYIASQGKDPSTIVQYILSTLDGTSGTLRIRLLGIRDNYGFSALDVLVKDFDDQVVFPHFWKGTHFSTTYDSLVIGSPPLHFANNVPLLNTLLTRKDLEASWAEALYNKYLAKDPEIEYYLGRSLSHPSILFQIYPGSDSVLAMIIRHYPGVLRKKDRFGMTPSGQLLNTFKKEQLPRLSLLLKTEQELLGRRKELSTWYRMFAQHNTNTDVYQIIEAAYLMLDLEPDFSTVDEKGDSPLHYLGHTSWSGCVTDWDHRRYSCSFIFSSDVIKLLIIKHGRLFMPHADGTMPFTTILERISSHIGFIAFLLWDKFGGETRIFPIIAGMEKTAKEFQQQASYDYLTTLEEPELLEFLRVYCDHSLAKNTNGGGRFLFQALRSNAKTLTEQEVTFEVEEYLSLEDFWRYKRELGTVQAKWIELRDIAKKSWHTGKWQEGNWQDGSEWIERMAGKAEFLAMRNDFERKRAKK